LTRKVVLAYSGGLDTSIILPWLKENYGCEVIAMIGDVGQEEDLVAARAKALSTGASQAFVEDLRHEFVTGYIWPTLRSGAVYEHKYLLGTSFARPILAKRQVEIARQVGADALAHGCTGKGNDQVRFELTYRALAPDLRVIAPWREWDIQSREDALAYAASRGVPVTQSKKNLFSRDRNIWHLSHEGGPLEDPAWTPDESVWQWTCSPEKAPDSPDEVSIEFEEGVPVAADGRRLTPLALLSDLNHRAARHGIGRVDLVENRFVGIKSRGLYETPGGTLLLTAHRELEALCLDRETAHFKQQVALKYAELVYFGMWFTPLREALDEFIQATQQTVTGTVTLRLFKGNLTVAGRNSPYSLYSQDLASFSMARYNPRYAEGFIQLLGLPLEVRARLRERLQAESQRQIHELPVSAKAPRQGASPRPRVVRTAKAAR
jgi:argininosuccinate synthase